MLKQSLTLVLLLAFIAMTFSRAIILTSFMAKRNYIARVLCENRNKPVMKCGGKCCLSKKLNREERKDRENPERRAESKFEVMEMQEDHYLFQPARTISLLAYTELKENTYIVYRADFFHPPQA
jgi:hypothetical protein